MLTAAEREHLRREVDRRRREQLASRATSRRPPAVRYAIAFLEEQLSRGPRASSDVKAAAAREGIAPTTLRSAREALGVVTTNDGRAGSTWRLA